jgi:phosphatidylglycerophosphatase A
VAPGTAGSLVAAVALWFIPFSRLWFLAVLVIITLLGIWAAQRVETMTGHKDPGVIVVDEFAGMMLSVMFLPRTLGVFISAFLLFRLFDIWKPFPIREVERRVKGGFGVMIDDVIASAYAYFCFVLFVLFVYKLLPLPG